MSASKPARTPAISTELIEWLEACYPDRCPTEDMSDREIWIAAGAAKLIRRLRTHHKDQAVNALVQR